MRCRELLLRLAYSSVIATAAWGTELPEGKHRELVVAICSACHSLALVAQNHLDRPQWEATLKGMEARHNLVIPAPELREKILDYLVEKFGPLPDKIQEGVSGLPSLRLNPLPLTS